MDTIILNGFQDIEDLIVFKLKNEWIILTGHSEIISNVEQKYFTPNTPKNKDFDVILNPIFPFALCKRNQRFMSQFGKNNENIIALELKPNEKPFAIYRKTKSINCYREFAKKLTQLIEEACNKRNRI